MNSYIKHFASVVIISAVSSSAYAGGSAEASIKALESSVQAVGYSVESGYKLVSGSIAIPLILVGEIGKISGDIGHGFWDEANASPRGPLAITDEVISIGPNPVEQLNRPD